MRTRSNFVGLRFLRFLLLLLFVALGPAACGRGCSWAEGEKTYESLDGPVKVELVRDVRWTGGRISAPVARFAVRIHREPVVDFPVECDHVDMAENEGGSLVAFRCKGASTWDLVRRTPGGEDLRECAAEGIGTANPPGFGKLTSLSSAATRILSCGKREDGVRMTHEAWKDLAHALENAEGPTVAASVIAKSAELPADITSGIPDGFWGGLEGLGEGARAEALRALCTVLDSETSNAVAYVRAARTCDIARPVAGLAAAAHLEKALGAVVRAGKAPLSIDWDEAKWSAAVGLERAPTETGLAACRASKGLAFPSFGADDAFALATSVMARAGVPCEAVKAWLASNPCASEFVCDGGPCAPDAMRLDAGACSEVLREVPDAGPRALVCAWDRYRSFAAAVYAQGPLPADVVRRNVRRTYALDRADAGPCEASSSPGAPCTCAKPHLISSEACRIPPTNSAGEVDSCAFRIDDAHRRIHVVRASAPDAAAAPRPSARPH